MCEGKWQAWRGGLRAACVVQNCRMRFWRICLLIGWLEGSSVAGGTAWAAHAYAMWGAPALAADFAHFPYVNPQAPKGGELRLVSNLRTSTFDKYNPFTIRGNAPAYLSADNAVGTAILGARAVMARA